MKSRVVHGWTGTVLAHPFQNGQAHSDAVNESSGSSSPMLGTLPSELRAK